MYFVFLLFYFALGENEVPKISVDVEVKSLKCQGLIISLFIVSVPCSCVMIDGTKASASAFAVKARNANLTVRDVRAHPKCTNENGIYLYDNSFLVTRDKIDFVVNHSPVRTPALTDEEFMVSLKKQNCTFLTRDTLFETKFVELKKCLDVAKCKSDDCRSYFDQYVVCVSSEVNGTNGMPLISNNGMTWGYYTKYPKSSFFAVVKIFIMSQLEKSSAVIHPGNIIRLILIITNSNLK